MKRIDHELVEVSIRSAKCVANVIFAYVKASKSCISGIQDNRSGKHLLSRQELAIRLGNWTSKYKRHAEACQTCDIMQNIFEIVWKVIDRTASSYG
jgi:hypothetical protein